MGYGTTQSPSLPRGLKLEQRTGAICPDRLRTLLGFRREAKAQENRFQTKSGTQFWKETVAFRWAAPPPGVPRRAAGFTLIELLTVITILAILATLLMTTLSSVKRKAREAVCTSNLRQIGISLQLYLEDYDGHRPPDLQTLAASKYLGGDGRILTCPADRSSSVPALTDTADLAMDIKGIGAPEASNAARPIHVSYQHPLGWSDEEWNRLMQAHTRAGVVACTFHDVRASARNAPSDGLVEEGLVLRGQLDGTVLRRQVFRSETVPEMNAMAPSADRSPPGAVSAPGPVDSLTMVVSFPPWNFFSDEPAP